MSALVIKEVIEDKIFLIRGHKVMLDRDLAQLYNVSTKVLNQAVKRKMRRFPSDFMFSLTKEETRQLVTNCDRFRTMKHSSAFPHVFTEQGVTMLSTVLNSERAIQVNIEIMRTFVRLREILSTNKDLARKLEKLEKRYDTQFRAVFDAIRHLMYKDQQPKQKIGFHA